MTEKVRRPFIVVADILLCSVLVDAVTTVPSPPNPEGASSYERSTGKLTVEHSQDADISLPAVVSPTFVFLFTVPHYFLILSLWPAVPAGSRAPPDSA